MVTQLNLAVGDYVQMLAVQGVWLAVLWGLSQTAMLLIPNLI